MPADNASLIEIKVSERSFGTAKHLQGRASCKSFHSVHWMLLLVLRSAGPGQIYKISAQINMLHLLSVHLLRLAAG